MAIVARSPEVHEVAALPPDDGSCDPAGDYGEAYEGFVGDDPEWDVRGSLAGHDPDLTQVAARTLVTTGRWDRVTPPTIAHEIHARLPNSKLAVFERSAHRPWVEEPDAWFALVDDFLRAG